MTNNAIVKTNGISAARVSGAVTSAINTNKKGRDAIHIALCASVQYAWENKGAGLDKYMTKLYQGLFDNDIKSFHQQMKEWTESNFPIKVLFDKDKQRYTCKLSKKWDNLTDNDWQFDAAKETPFFKLNSSSAADAKPITYEQLLLQLKRMAVIEQQDKRPIADKDKALVHQVAVGAQALLDSLKVAA